MKKKISRANYPFHVLLILIMIVSTAIFLKGRIPLTVFIIFIIFPLTLITYRKELHISYKTKELRIFKLVLFLKLFVNKIIPFRIVILSHHVYRNRISGKFGFAGSSTESTYRLLIFEKDNEKPSFEVSGMKDYIEELGSFISTSLNIEIERKTLRDNRHWKYDLSELNNEKD